MLKSAPIARNPEKNEKHQRNPTKIPFFENGPRAARFTPSIEIVAKSIAIEFWMLESAPIGRYPNNTKSMKEILQKSRFLKILPHEPDSPHR